MYNIHFSIIVVTEEYKPFFLCNHLCFRIYFFSNIHYILYICLAEECMSDIFCSILTLLVFSYFFNDSMNFQILRWHRTKILRLFRIRFNFKNVLFILYYRHVELMWYQINKVSINFTNLIINKLWRCYSYNYKNYIIRYFA